MHIKDAKSKYSKSDQSFLRDFNTKKLLNILRERGPMSRVELAEVSNLDKKTVTNIVNDMFANNQVRVLATESTGLGRPKEILSLNGEFSRCIGIDLGGTHITGVIIDFTGNILASHSIDIHNNVETDILIQLCDLIISQLLKKAELSIDDISEIGVAFQGHIDVETGEAILSENVPNWNSVMFRTALKEKYKKEILMDDCSRLMTLAELWHGEGRYSDNFIVFDLGLGIGCGMVINGQIYAGSKGKSGEVGHTIVKVDGPECTCGRRGCIESLASGWALSKQAKMLAEKYPNGLLAEVTKNAYETPSTKDIVLAAELGDKECYDLLVNAGKCIAIGIANSISLINPSKVIIGGRLIKDNNILLESIIENVKLQTIPELYKDSIITTSKLGSTASAIGAATLCLKKHYE
ncbi:MAG TPA: ROK family protein [Clostridiaceae bacterium]|nr:ROK family protein [Clostridiaceae bacterium]